MVIWYKFSHFGILYQEKSVNPIFYIVSWANPTTSEFATKTPAL
jgi:hypothetical protein